MDRLHETPATLAARLEGQEGLIWLDSALAADRAVSFLTAWPVRVFEGSLEKNGQELETALQSGAAEGLGGGLYGWVGYDGNYVLGAYPHGLLYDHGLEQWFETGDFLEKLNACAGSAPSRLPEYGPEFQPQVTREAFIHQVERAQEYIRAGDIYQVNLSHPWVAEWPEGQSAMPFYQRLRQVSPAPHAAFLRLKETTLLSASPELFLRMSGQSVATHPIKGTRPRFPEDAARDVQARQELLACEKERAELLMITDLERNDLGQVCEYGSVQVPDLWRVESFAQVYHLVPSFTGRLRPEISHVEAFRACFPGGSITGAPKKRAMEIIEELESRPRGIYTGAVGGFGFDGESRWSIAIRTAVLANGQASFHAGSGIVADSIPEREWEETLHKASGILAACGRTAQAHP